MSRFWYGYLFLLGVHHVLAELLVVFLECKLLSRVLFDFIIVVYVIRITLAFAGSFVAFAHEPNDFIL